MARRLYYRDSYGRVYRARAAERNSGGSRLPAFPVMKILMILAAIVVLASFVR
jgi:hypothetical protein